MSQEAFAPLPCSWAALVTHPFSNDFRKQPQVIRSQVGRVSHIIGSPTLGSHSPESEYGVFLSPGPREPEALFQAFLPTCIEARNGKGPWTRACGGAIAVVPGQWVGIPGPPWPSEEAGGQHQAGKGRGIALCWLNSSSEWGGSLSWGALSTALSLPLSESPLPFPEQNSS